MELKKPNKILAIEDDDYIQEIFTSFLGTDGYDVISASDGVEGIEKFHKENPDLILLDLHIPKMHGFDVLTTLVQKSPGIPVIVVSGTADINDAIKAIRLGAWDFVTKPILDLRVLEHAVKKAFERLRLLFENKRYRERLEELVLERTKELEKELGLRQQAEEKLLSSLNEKDVLLKEIHHRVKNNLQVISSLLNLQSGFLEDQKAHEILKESQNRVKSMALIHEKMYQSENLSRIDFSEYIRNLVDYLFSTYKMEADKIRLEIKVDDAYLGVDKAIPCGLIINELVSNSLKYAFPGEHNDEKDNKLELQLLMEKKQNETSDEDYFSLIVRDNGVGFPEDYDITQTESLGLQPVFTLVDQLQGKLQWDIKNKAEFIINFTVKYN